VENALDRLEGVSSYDIQPTTGNVIVTYDSTTLSDHDLTTAIENAGYDIADSSDATSDTETASHGPDEHAAHANMPGSVWKSERAIKTWI
ncbi:heavy-metal-associated domain-containing protein, partial [Aeromonas schubertii]|uniref:heavy-metal-associated domain-containing protein n=1 Tax=Aeromonas schubertii TaxID=652 RepID=UPI0038B5B947